MRLSRVAGLIFAWLALVVTLTGADVGPRRALLQSQPPGWVKSNYGKFGALPDLAFNFDQSLGWQRGQGQGNPSRFLTVSRASTAYEDDTAGNWYLFQANQLRQTNKGALIEESRTNSIRNNSMQGAVPGTPGTRPTNWGVFNVAGLTSSIAGPGVSSGIDTLDVTMAGTSTSTLTAVSPEASTQVAASTGQTWTLSAWLAITGGDLTNVTSAVFRITEKTSGGANVLINDSSDFKASLTSSLIRFSYTVTLSGGATTAFIQPSIVLNVTNGAAINYTLRIGWPQLELGASVTSPIRTTSAAVTRSADVVTVTRVPTIGSAFTLFAAGTPTAPTGYGTTQTLLSVNDGSSSNRLELQRLTGTGVARYAYVVSGSLTQNAGAAWSQSAAGKLTAAGTTGDQAGDFNGGSAFTSAGAGTPGGLSTLNVGSGFTGGNAADAYITRIAVWPSNRIPNAGLIAGTTP